MWVTGSGPGLDVVRRARVERSRGTEGTPDPESTGEKWVNLVVRTFPYGSTYRSSGTVRKEAIDVGAWGAQ